MSNERAIARTYSLNLARMKPGKQEESFDLDQAFFEHFDYGLSQSGSVTADLKMHKYDTHLDVTFHVHGDVFVECDRCLTPYAQPIDSRHRIIYSFDPEMNFEGEEVIHVEPNEPNLVIAQELYDFVHVSLPFRKVPPKEVHLCDPETLALLGLDAEGNPDNRPAAPQDEDDIDPRWAALKKLKDEQNED